MTDRKERLKELLKNRREAQQPWDLAKALEFIRDLAPRLKDVGFYPALAGSVLINGQSGHDLDLIVYPHDSSNLDLRKAQDVFHEFGMIPLWQNHEIKVIWSSKMSNDMKFVEIWGFQNRRVDIFFLR